MKHPKILPELEAFIPPLQDDERERLRLSVIASGGPRDPLIVWRERNVLLDGHHRLAICKQRRLPYKVEYVSLPSIEDAKAWMFAHQTSRRNLSRDQLLALAAARGVDYHGEATPRQREMAATLAGEEPGARERLEAVIEGRLVLAIAFGAHERAMGRGKRKARNKPPSAPHTTEAQTELPAGHELFGVSRLSGPEGEHRGQWDRTRVAGSEDPPVEVPPDHLIRRTATFRRGDGTTTGQWITTEPERVQQWESAKSAVIEHVKTYVYPAPPVPAAEGYEDGLLVQYNLGDPHIGMLAWGEEVGGHSFDLKIAERELVECMRQMVARSPRAKYAEVVNLGDFWHAQDDNARTPRGGNKLDVDGRAGKIARVGLRIFQSLVDLALQHHEHVGVRSLRGNHDLDNALWLPEIMRARYDNEPRITVYDAFDVFQYRTFGSCLFGWTHGHKERGVFKAEELAQVMATDQAAAWGASTFRYWNCGHVHHWSSKDAWSVFVETHRTLAAQDAWHRNSGYRSNRALKSQWYHRDYGLDGSAIVSVERVRDAIAKSL